MRNFRSAKNPATTISAAAIRVPNTIPTIAPAPKPPPPKGKKEKIIKYYTRIRGGAEKQGEKSKSIYFTSRFLLRLF